MGLKLHRATTFAYTPPRYLSLALFWHCKQHRHVQKAANSCWTIILGLLIYSITLSGLGVSKSTPVSEQEQGTPSVLSPCCCSEITCGSVRAYGITHRCQATSYFQSLVSDHVLLYSPLLFIPSLEGQTCNSSPKETLYRGMS